MTKRFNISMALLGAAFLFTAHVSPAAPQAKSSTTTGLAAPTATVAGVTPYRDPLTSSEAFATRSAPMPAPAVGGMTAGATYTATLDTGVKVRFLFQSTGMGYIESAGLYGKLCRRGTDGIFRLTP